MGVQIPSMPPIDTFSSRADAWIKAAFVSEYTCYWCKNIVSVKYPNGLPKCCPNCGGPRE